MENARSTTHPGAGALLGLRFVGDEVASPNGTARWPRHAVPLVVSVISIVVAVGAVSFLILVLFKTTTGPGQALRQYYEAVSAGSCDAAYERLADPLQASLPPRDFCLAVDGARDRGVPADIEILEVTGFGEPPARSARVTIREIGPRSEPDPLVWQMARQGGDWFVAEIPQTGRCDVDGVTPCVPL